MRDKQLISKMTVICVCVVVIPRCKPGDNVFNVNDY